jgi:hypothetical protein
MYDENKSKIHTKRPCPLFRDLSPADSCPGGNVLSDGDGIPAAGPPIRLTAGPDSGTILGLGMIDYRFAHHILESSEGGLS